MTFQPKTVYQVLRYNFYDNFRLNSSSWENDWITRIFNRHETSFSESEVHESVLINGLRIRKIRTGFIYHFPYESVSQLIDKMQFYSTLYAKQNLGKKKPSLPSIPFRAMMMFLKCYILKRGFLCGYEGLVVSSYNAIGVFTKYIKLYELINKRKVGMALMVEQSFAQLKLCIDAINQQTLLPEQVIIMLDDSILQQQTKEVVLELLRTMLVVPYTLIGEVNQDVGTVINSYLIQNPQLNNIVYLSGDSLLRNKNIFRECKLSLHRGETLPGVEIFSN
jgi:hypothetical protein